ncbi:DegT/DnrJ/EryC1/StrS family aminotransferase [Spirulina subsalsa FACHB-351]|uniref:DegT/DnrJ/EryC1/StrS family aminotransferase n=2 Tax=Spirulina subsalsa TaxID=54311 RepID=A0ABT3L352_9CYAN|nr:DegT/DnrJ/EryC1/StrS family aminotransferase [Spirulina subsalsa FACHB-351]
MVSLPSDQDASGRTLGEAEIRLVAEAINSGTLTGTKGTFVKQLEQEFAQLLGVKYAYSCASGSAAVHVAIAAIDPEPGDEIVTTAITDMGALTPILYQGAIPVFADVDPRTWNVTAASIEQVLSDRTKAIIVTHLFGNPCEMTEIMALAQSRHIPVIEDCAQAFLATHNGQYVGAIGDIGCFSLQQGKHITTGEGGIVTTNDDALARRMFLFINKAWGYGDPQPDHYFLALNYRMSELQGAVAVAQLQKLPEIVQARRTTADQLTEQIQDLPGITPPWLDPRNTHSYWKYCLSVDSAVVPDGALGLAKRLKAEKGIFSAPRYIQKPAFQCEVFREQRTFGNSRFPFTLARPEAIDYSPEKYPGSFAGLEAVLVLPWNERYTIDHVNYIATSLGELLA